MSDPMSDWRTRLLGDPAPWLLDETDNPSIAFWFQRDIVGRPEDAPTLQALREQILYSRPVQELFAAQNESGYWESSTSLDLPRYRATMWSLALLVELGLSRNSRRGRTACEFILENHVNEDGAFTGLREFPHAGLLVRSLLYFGYGTDSRLARMLDRLSSDAAAGNVYALWAFAELGSSKYGDAVSRGTERLLHTLGAGTFHVYGAYPPFEAQDAVLALRVLALLGRLGDQRTKQSVEGIWALQENGARWTLQMSLADLSIAGPEPADTQRKWATLNALRIVTR